MKLTTKSRYGVRMLLGLTIFADEGVISVRSASKHLQLSTKYIESICLALKKNHFIESVRGINGGYRLAMKPEDISIYNVITSMETYDSLAPRHVYPDLLARVTFRELWYKVDSDIKEYLSNISIADLIEMNGGLEEIKKRDWYKSYFDNI